jgi:S-adenosylmethionine-diacylglycerol 3-amino-3-carboxypropyl transferase
MSNDAALPQWMLQAAQMPLAFAQVREDSLVDLRLLDRIAGDDIRGIMIASGGCTAAMLAASGRLAHLHLVDMNPAQIALSRVKLHLLLNATPIDRARLLGHASPARPREAAIAGILESLELSADALGPPDIIAEWGPDHAGRYELLFSRLRTEMQEFADQWAHVLNLNDASARTAQTQPGAPMGRAMDDAFDRVMALENLTRLFSAEATQNSAVPFSQHFAARTRQAIATLPTVDNPYLWQMLLGRFPPGVMYPWLAAAAPAQLPDVVTSIGPFDHALAEFRDDFDFVHLSNILDWLSCDAARRMLELARAALRPGGFVWIRQLNSTLRLPELCAAFEWLEQDAADLHHRDRSFFYTRLLVGRKR